MLKNLFKVFQGNRSQQVERPNPLVRLYEEPEEEIVVAPMMVRCDVPANGLAELKPGLRSRVYTTKIDAHKSISEIQRILAKAGANAIMHEYDDNGFIVALSFRLTINGHPMAFRLPTDWRPVLETLQFQRKKYKQSGKRFRAPVDQDQALRVAWRITKDWVEAQLAIIETRMVTTEQVFLPYAVTDSGQTLYERFQENPTRLLSSGRDQ